MAAYQKIFDIKLTHTYYTKSFENDFDIVPTEETLALLKNHKLQVRSTDTGITVLGETDGGVPAKMMRRLSANAKFRFAMVLKRSEFLNFTHLPLNDNSGTIYYFNNLVDNSLKLFESGSYISESERNNIKSPVFELSGLAVNDDIEIVKAEDSTASVYQLNDIDETSAQIDLRGISEGLYDVKINAVIDTSRRFYLGGSLTSRVKAFGIIEIFNRHGQSGDNVVSSYQFIDESGGTKQIQSKEYTLDFNARSTTWRYYVAVRDNTALKSAIAAQPDVSLLNLDVNTNDSPSQGFSRVAYVTNAVDDKIVQIDSDTAIAYDQQATRHLELTFNGTELINDMPNASIKNLTPDDMYASNDETYSEIYVYV